MTVREETQTIERLTLSPYAALSEQSFGRRTPEPEDDLRTCYQRDRDRILHCKSFRRLKQKTQVFLSPEGDHYRTRLTHTRDAVQVLGDTKSRRITTMITDLVANSANCKNGKMQFSPEVEEAYGVLKDFMYSTVYVDKDAKREEKKVDKMIEALYERLCADPTLMPNFYMQVAYHQGMDRAVADYISGMSDEFATRLFEELFVPQKWQVL